MLKATHTELEKQAYCSINTTYFWHLLGHFLASRCRTGGDGAQSGQLGANLAQLRANLGPTWGQLRANLGPTSANLGQLGPTWGQLRAFLRELGQLGPKMAQLGANLGPTWVPKALGTPPEGHLGASAGRFSALRGTISAPSSTFLGACSKLSCAQSVSNPAASTARRPCVTSTCGLVRRRTAGQ